MQIAVGVIMVFVFSTQLLINIQKKNKFGIIFYGVCILMSIYFAIYFDDIMRGFLKK